VRLPPEVSSTLAGREALVRLVRDEGRRVLATLVRTTGSLELAEDAVQDAIVKAIDSWSRNGVPPEPRAWLTMVARNRALDLMRREAKRPDKETEAEILVAATAAVTAPEVVDDDLLRLIFTCCHPSLGVETQTALALRTLCGLTTAEVARALLVPEATMAKRLTRARRKIAVAKIPYRVPASDELPTRLIGVLATIYLLFNEGYNASAGEDLIRSDLTEEAIRLSRLLYELLPEEPGTSGLLALLLLQSSRHAARLDAVGEIVLLSEQDRDLWDTASIREGMSLLGVALRRTPTRPELYATQAAIAACHALAPTWEETNWEAVLSWYDVLLVINDSPTVRLNRAVALSKVNGPQAGLDALEEVGSFGDTSRVEAVRGDLLQQVGNFEDAASSYQAALSRPANWALRRYLAKQLAACGEGLSMLEAADPSAVETC
jgi:RNA polymerase sigma factor (sigma-70 family)